MDFANLSAMKPTTCHRLRALMFGGAFFLASLVQAQTQTVLRPADFYFDEDRSVSRPLAAQRGEGDVLVDRLLRQIQRDPRAWEAMAQLGGLAMAGGRVDAGKDFYQRAINGVGSQHGLARAMRWNYGWDLYRSGDAAGALAQWQELARSSPVRGSWIPPALALASWQAGERDEALKWYAAAVRTEPNQWTSPTDLAALLPDWRASERATLLEVQRAWAANPPAWP